MFARILACWVHGRHLPLALLFVAIAAAHLASCKRADDASVEQSGSPPPPVAKTAQVPNVAAPPTPAEAPKPESMLVEVNGTAGQLGRLLAEHGALARQAGLDLYVEFSADWCAPCRAVKEYADDPLMKKARLGAYIVVADYDTFTDEATEMDVRGIPTWVALDHSGKPTGRSITSSAWGEDIPENMAPVLSGFFSGQPAAD